MTNARCSVERCAPRAPSARVRSAPTHQDHHPRTRCTRANRPRRIAAISVPWSSTSTDASRTCPDRETPTARCSRTVADAPDNRSSTSAPTRPCCDKNTRLRVSRSSPPPSRPVAVSSRLVARPLILPVHESHAHRPRRPHARESAPTRRTPRRRPSERIQRVPRAFIVRVIINRTTPPDVLIHPPRPRASRRAHNASERGDEPRKFFKHISHRAREDSQHRASARARECRTAIRRDVRAGVTAPHIPSSRASRASPTRPRAK